MSDNATSDVKKTDETDMRSPWRRSLDRLKEIDYGKWRRRVFNFVVFVASLLVLMVTLVIMILAAISYPRIKRTLQQIDSLQDQVDKLLNASIGDLVLSIVGIIASLIKEITGSSLTSNAQGLVANHLLMNADDDIGGVMKRISTNCGHLHHTMVVHRDDLMRGNDEDQVKLIVAALSESGIC
jgi:hypothetical protein